MVRHRRPPLREAISGVVSEKKLTYRQICDAINARGLYRPGDGLYLPVAQVRACVRENWAAFSIDKTCVPNLVGASSRTSKLDS
jgi:hypothetical protein